MADLEKSVAIIFEGVDQMGAGVDSATKRMNSIVGSAQGVVDPIANATTGILKFNAAVIASGAAATALAVKMAGDFDSQFREITTLIDAPAESLEGLRDSILEYATQSSQSIPQITESIYSIVSAGADAAEALSMLNEVEQLSIGGKTDLGTAASALSGVLNAYGESTESATAYSDTFFVGMRNGITTVDELARTMPAITPLASQLGVDFDTLTAAVSALTSSGLPTSQAVTQVGAALNAILGPTQQASSLAEELGIEFDATALRTQGLSGFLDTLAEATGGSEAKMKTLFGSSEATRGVLSLTGTAAEQFTEILVEMDNKAGATAEAHERMAGSIDQGNQRIINSFSVMMIGIGTPLLDEFGGIQDAIAQIFNAIGASVTGGQLQKFVGLIEGVMQSLEETLSDVATNLPKALEAADMSGFINGFEAVRDAISGLFDNADITTVEGLASVIATLGTGVELLGEFTAGTVAAIGPFIETLAELAAIVLKIDPAWALMLGTIGGSAVVLSTVLSAFASLSAVLIALGGTNGAVPAVTRVLGSMGAALGKLAGPTGAVLMVAYAAKELKGTLDEFNEFRFNFSDELEAELDKTTGAQRKANEAGLFSLQKLAEGYVALSDYFGWGEEAAQDFEVLGGAGEQAALQVMAAATRIGNEAPEEIKKLSQEAINSAVLIGSAANDIESAFRGFETPLIDQIVNLPGTLSEAADALSSGEASIVATSEEIRKALSRVQNAFNSGDINEQQYLDLTAALLELKDGTDAAASSQEALAGEVLSSEEAILKARQAVLDQTLALEELASNERIKNMEFAVDFKIAQMEADAKKVEAILNATSTTIASTAEAAASMFETLGGGGLNFSDRWLARDAIDQQLEIQKQAAEQQGKLIEAQIESLTAKTKALQNGDGLIKIESDGLEPALEMVMWQILEKIQLRANAESAEFLLGINSAAAP